jgi:hypothetical protein
MIIRWTYEQKEIQRFFNRELKQKHWVTFDVKTLWFLFIPIFQINRNPLSEKFCLSCGTERGKSGCDYKKIKTWIAGAPAKLEVGMVLEMTYGYEYIDNNKICSDNDFIWNRSDCIRWSWYPKVDIEQEIVFKDADADMEDETSK